MGPVIQGRALSVAEERNIDSQMQETQDTIDGVEIAHGVDRIALDKKKLREKLAYLRRVKETRGIRRVEGRERAAVEAEEKVLRLDLQKGMPTWKIYSRTKRQDGPTYVKLVDWILKSEQDPRRRRNIQRWRSLRRMLEPENVRFASVIFLFPGAEEGF